MNFKNDKNLQRAIIIENYENPNKKVEENFLNKDFKSLNFSSTSCIDNLTLFLKIEDNKIKEAFFNGMGCAVSTASTNIFCNVLINKETSIALKIIENYENMLLEKEYDENILEDLSIFEDIKKQPNRINCASIAPSTIKKIIEE